MTRTFDIGIDADGVLHNFGESFRQYVISENIRSEHECSPVVDYEFYLDWGLTHEEFVEICHEGVDAGVIFMHGEPFPDAPEGMARLKEAGHRLHIVTDRFFGAENAAEDLTRRWLARYAIPYDSLTFSADKTVVRTDYFLDDKIENYDALVRAGTQAYLYTRSWNEQKDKRTRVNSFTEFCEAIERHAEERQHAFG